MAHRPAASETKGPGAAGPVLLFDGVCHLCNWTVRVVLRLDRRGVVRFAPLGGRLAEAVAARHPHIREVDSLVLVEPRDEDLGGRGERVLVKSDAVLALAHHLGGPCKLVGVLRLVPRTAREWAYDLIARHRYALFGRLALRPAPPANARARFLD